MQGAQKIDGPRGCRTWELGELLDFLSFIFKPSQNENSNIGSEYSHIINFAINNSENLRIIKYNNEIVSHVGIYPIYVKVDELKLKVGAIFAVATHPNYRNKGLATILLKDAIEKMTREDYDLSILWTGIPEFYRKFGWENAGSKVIFHFNTSNIGLLPSYDNLEIEKVGSHDKIRDIVSLRNKTNGVILDELTARFLILRRPIEAFLVSKNKESLGYVIVKNSMVIDFAGDTNLILSLIKYVFSLKELTNLEFQVPLNSREANVLKYFGIPFEESYLGMIKIISLHNLERLLLNCGLQVDEVEDSHYLVKQYVEERKLNEKELVKLIFGPEVIAPFKCSMLPINFYLSPIDQV